MKSNNIIMKVKVKYFAGLKERIGYAEDEVELPEGARVCDLWRQVSHDDNVPERVMTAVNMEYVQADTPIRDGDEVAFFPPVTGG